LIANNDVSLWRQTILPSLSLFTSVGTLLCCALPALLVTLGMGAALAGFVGAAPWVTAVSDYKGIVFAVAMIGPVCGYIIDDMSNVLHYYQIDEHVPA